MLGSTHTVVDLDTENTLHVKVIRRHLQASLESILEAHPWSFATAYTELALVQEQPTNSWGFEYDYPADCMTIRRLGIEGLFPHIEEYYDQRDQFIEVDVNSDTHIYTNVGKAHAEYTRKLDVDRGFPNHFGRAFAAQLAMDIAPSIITNNFSKVKDLFMKEARNEISKQIAVDLAKKPQTPTSESPFYRARL